MTVYITGPHMEDLESIGITLNLSGVDAHVITPEMTCLEIYEEILGCDAVVLVYSGSKEELVEICTELGIAIALGKPVYAVRSVYVIPNRFFGVGGVREFKDVDAALGAVLADLGETNEDSVRELAGLGTDSSDGGD